MDRMAARQMIIDVKLRVTPSNIQPLNNLTQGLPAYEANAINAYARTYQNALIMQNNGTLDSRIKEFNNTHKEVISDSISTMAKAGIAAGAVIGAFSVQDQWGYDLVAAKGGFVGGITGCVAFTAAEYIYRPFARIRGVPGMENIVGSKEYIRKKDKELESILVN